MPQPGQPIDNDQWWNTWRLAHGSGQWQTAFMGYLHQQGKNPERLTGFELDQQYTAYVAYWTTSTGSPPP